MKTLLKTAILFVFMLAYSISNFAQTEIPTWINQVPKKSGYLYAAGIGKSSDISMAHKKARTIALTELTKSYNTELDKFAKTCDTIVGKNDIRQIITTIKSQHEAAFVGVEEIEKASDTSGTLNVVYLLIRVEINNDIKLLKKTIEKDDIMGKKSNKARLLEELNKL